MQNNPAYGQEPSIKAWVKVFRIIPEFRILRLVSLKMLNFAGNNSFSDLVSGIFPLNM